MLMDTEKNQTPQTASDAKNGDSFGGAPVNPPPVSNNTGPSRSSGKGCLLGGILGCLGLLVIGGVCLTLLVSSLQNLTDIPVQFPKPKGKKQIGLLRLEGMITDGEAFRESLAHYEKDSQIRGILLRVDSPGGAVGASQELMAAVERLREKGKVVVASFGNIAASGGYYVACGADAIFANPGTLTGSIGVIFSAPNIEQLAEKMGVSQNVIKSGKFKDTGSIMRPMKPEERAYLQNVIADTHRQFVEDVQRCREEALQEALGRLSAEDIAFLGKSPADAQDLLESLADGRVYTGRQALRFGLVDRLGGQKAALNYCGDLLGLSEPELYEYQPRRNLMELLTQEAHSLLGKSALSLPSSRLEYRWPLP